MRLLVLAVVLVLLWTSVLSADEKPQRKKAPKTPVELGLVPWERDFDKATARAKSEKKPLLVLFQEVPG